jgi:hypothetical protein
MATLLKPWIIRYLDDRGRQCPKATPGARKVKVRASNWYAQIKGTDGLALFSVRLRRDGHTHRRTTRWGGTKSH